MIKRKILEALKITGIIILVASLLTGDTILTKWLFMNGHLILGFVTIGFSLFLLIFFYILLHD
ncbi:hypothetical protein P8881_19505 [Bacillus haynesii]|uniref:hypothetical protein n=1 Tax=Bacillus haynesii TaxID=1925021 RepID=UPI002280BDB4|nr:hypothetical protein [Bacillus haynesii]MCY8737522.1 hypothetical protein [Bacillus haynesii]MEC0709713.1 hypothetical protein [Bacillus haynesii]MEC0736908.1 hypothetical protein [Bacillus haynesii]